MDENSVPEDWACPHCEEARMDFLEIDEEDEELITCHTCGKQYWLIVWLGGALRAWEEE